MKKVLAILSGGMDSAVALALWIENNRGGEVHALTFYYGQTHQAETLRAEELVKHYKVRRHLIKDIRPTFRGIVTKGALTHSRPVFEGDVPKTYVPARNFIFISLATAYAVSNDIDEVITGIHATDAPYPDCRVGVLNLFNEALYLGTPNGVAVLHPLLSSSKQQIVEMGHKLKVPFEKTLTCYFPLPGSRPCRECDSCKVRMEAFEKAGLVDPAYAYEVPGPEPSI